MESKEKTLITVKATVNVPVEIAWKFWTKPEHITQWNYANDDWHTTWAKNDLKVGGKFISRMESKDGSVGFDFSGVYETVRPYEMIEYVIEDGRKVKITFAAFDKITNIIETFEAETVNSYELQNRGWQSILDNFKRYAEASKLK